MLNSKIKEVKPQLIKQDEPKSKLLPLKEVGVKAGGTACWMRVTVCPERRETEREPVGKARKEGDRERQNRLETRPALGEREAALFR